MGVMAMMEMTDTGVATGIMAAMMAPVDMVEATAGMMVVMITVVLDTMMVYLLQILLRQGLAVVQAVMATGVVEDMVVVEDPEVLQVVAQVEVMVAEAEILQAHRQPHSYLQTIVLLTKSSK